MKRTTYAYLAAFCFLIGIMIYILFRPTSLLIFHWVDFFGLMPIIYALRSYSHNFIGFLPNWFVYSLPFALWVSSYLLCIRAIWGQSVSRSHYLWFWFVPIVSITVELFQHLHILPGTFDFLDLLTIGLTTALIFFIPIFNKSTAGGRRK